MGADMIIVPRNTQVNITSSLLTVQPTEEVMPGSIGKELERIPGVARVAPQKMVSVSVEGQRFKVIAFDPETDFTVLNWLGRPATKAFAAGDLLAGSSVSGQPGETLSVCSEPLRVYGRLGRTGVGPFDEAYFVTFETLARLAGKDLHPATESSLSRASMKDPSGMDHSMHDSSMRDAALPSPSGSESCLAGYIRDKVTAYLLQLSPTARPEQVRFAISEFSDLKVIEGNNIMISSRQGLHTLFVGIASFTGLLLIALLILVALLFSAIVQERYREVGILRALGGKPGQVMSMILAEAAMMTALGGFGGILFGVTLLFIFARSLVFYFDSLGVPFRWPPVGFFVGTAIGLVAFSAGLGLFGALIPAWHVRRAEPFVLIRSGER